MMRTALVALLVGAVLTACGIRIVKYEFSEDHTVAEKYTSVRVRTSGGEVSIRHVPGLSETKIHRKVEHNKDNKPTGVSHRVEGNTLVLDDCGHDCDVNYDVQVPYAEITVQGDVGSGTATIEGLASVDYKTGSGDFYARNIAGNVQITSGSGDVDVSDIAGDVKAITNSGKFGASKVKGSVTADLGSGNITLDQLQGKVLANTGTGNINGTALDNDVTADADSGNVELNFVSARTVRVVTGSGNLTVRVPSSAGPYRVTAESGSGDRRVDVPTDPAAKYELRLIAESGNVKVLAV
jgi:DUF4097 and DUF4098 domain-containing protein YvlB